MFGYSFTTYLQKVLLRQLSSLWLRGTELQAMAGGFKFRSVKSLVIAPARGGSRYQYSARYVLAFKRLEHFYGFLARISMIYIKPKLKPLRKLQNELFVTGKLNIFLQDVTEPNERMSSSLLKYLKRSNRQILTCEASIFWKTKIVNVQRHGILPVTENSHRNQINKMLGFSHKSNSFS